MMGYTVEFKKVSEQKPRMGEYIFWVDEDKYYCGYDIKMGEVDYTWKEIDENGKDTGNGIIYHTGDPDILENHRLAIVCNEKELNSSVVWCPAIDFDTMLDNAAKG